MEGKMTLPTAMAISGAAVNPGAGCGGDGVTQLTADLYGYRKGHPEFPDEPTSDQFFDEKQFEAYRELGFQLTFQMLEDLQQQAKQEKRDKIQKDAEQLLALIGLAGWAPIENNQSS